jgi:hypothetical protein
MFGRSLLVLSLFVLIVGMCFGCSDSDDCQSCPGPVPPIQQDSDEDGVPNVDDNCPNVANPDQADADADGAGDLCDDCPNDPLDECIDTDEDGVVDVDDNCPNDANADQADADADGAGDVCDPCPNDPLDECTDTDEDGVLDVYDNCPNDANADQLDTDADGAGDVCDPCPDDPLDECAPDGPTILDAGVLDPTGCETYIGAHPIYPDQTGPDYEVVYEFCDNGVANKQWNPDPPAGIPGMTDGTGTWSLNGNELTIVTAATVMGALNMETTEVYDAAFAYDNGAKLDLNSAAMVPAGDGSTVLGNYERHSTSVIVMSGMFTANVDASSDTTMTVTDGAWEYTSVQETVCTGSPVICGGFGPPTTDEDSGTFAMPGELYKNGSQYIMQADDTLVLERQ